MNERMLIRGIVRTSSSLVDRQAVGKEYHGSETDAVQLYLYEGGVREVLR
jgi:hypothetical protein